MAVLNPAVCTILLSLAATVVYSHAVLTYPKARNGMSSGLGIKYKGSTATPWIPDPKTMPPCDDKRFPAGPPVATFEAGQNITVKWRITLDHNSPPGVTVSINYTPDSEFMTLVSGADEKRSQVPVTLPANKASENAVLRWMWQSKDDGGFYVGCSDIAIVASGTLAAAPELEVSKLALPDSNTHSNADVNMKDETKYAVVNLSNENSGNVQSSILVTDYPNLVAGIGSTLPPPNSLTLTSDKIADPVDRTQEAQDKITNIIMISIAADKADASVWIEEDPALQ